MKKRGKLFVFFALFFLFFLGCFTNRNNSNKYIYKDEDVLEIPEGLSVAVHYFSRSGNTKKVALAIAHTLGVEAVSIKDIGKIDTTIDILFLRAATYRNDVDKNVKAYIQTLDNNNIKRVVIFSTAGANSAYPIMKSLLNEKNIPVDDKNFFCRGHIFIENIGRPNQDDLDQAVVFTKEIISEQQLK
jgi:flavodoxin